MINKVIRIILISVLTLALTSCFYAKRKDGPPGYDVDVSKIPDATPKTEPLAKYGNMRSYRVFGRTYRTLSSSKHYQAIGVASWYGTKFHKIKTSSGEPYNMLAMTAAHRSLPLPTYVEVTNLKNNRKVIVKVNDRGPFAGNRLIDLSYVAAKKLGMLRYGTAYVRVKAIDPNAQESSSFFFASKKKAAPSYDIAEYKPSRFEKARPLFRDIQKIHTNKSLYLQVGAFRSKRNALNLQIKLSKMTESPVLIVRGTHLYHVKIGPLASSKGASTLKSRLKKLGLNANNTYGA